MYCKKCGNQIADGSKFCNSCGAQQNAPEISAVQSSAKKSLPIGAIIAIIIAAVIIIGGVIGGLVYKYNSSNGENNIPAEIDANGEVQNNSGAEKKNNGYVLVKEEYTGGWEPNYVKTIEYDSSGRISGEIKKDQFGNEDKNYDYKYDEQGNAVSCSCVDSEEEKFQITYEYDKNGNCILQTTAFDDSCSEIIEYKYDEHNNISYIRKTLSNDDEYENTQTRTLKYEDNKCVQIDETAIFEGETFYNIYKITYDENGNPEKALSYVDEHIGELGTERISENGINYFLEGEYTFTYAKLEDITK